MLTEFRTALLITLVILLVVIVVRRFKQYVKLRHSPVPQQVELVAVEVTYHPLMLRVEVTMPWPEEVFPAMLSHVHGPLHTWPAVQVSQGDHVFELPLADQVDGTYFFEIATSTQRTERRFTVRQA